MCGIAGEISFRREMQEMKETVMKMNTLLTPRGPDSQGIYCGENVCLGHRRLIVIDPDNGAQPMTSGDFTIVYNGELYNTSEIRGELARRGWKFTGHSDTEVVLKAFIEYGEGCLNLFNGIFAFAVWDKGKRELFLARDRIGVKPLFYSVTNKGLVFASEIKALFAHPEIKPIVTEDGIAQIMLAGPARFVGNGVFRDISDLPAGCCAKFWENGFSKRRYWSVKAKPHDENLDDTAEHLRELIIDSVKRQLISDVPLCCFLSGGLDSSIISAIAAKEFDSRGEKLSTWSIDYKNNHENFKASSFQPDEDAPWVRKMAEFIGSEHTNVILDSPALADALEDAVCARDLVGMADVDSSLWLFCREIKKRFTVALSGECADEIFGGYPWYHRKEVLFYDGFPWATSVPERSVFLKKPMTPSQAEEFIRRPYNECIARTDYLDSDNDYERRMREMFMLNLDYFMATLLDRKDRMSMAHGLEVRVPFCDYRLVEYAYNIPWEMKSYGGREKGLVRLAMKGILPDDVLWRKKSPYPKTHNPTYTYLLSERLKRLLDNSRLEEVVNIDALRKFIDTQGASFTKNWYGQLMTVPQIYAYFIQLDSWLRNYNVILA